MISALSVFPINDTIYAFDVLSNHASVKEQVVLDYFVNKLYWRTLEQELECSRKHSMNKQRSGPELNRI